jgi:DNA ligase-associated metallophosphoesterase
MNSLVAYTINENDFVLSPERVMFWEKQKALIIADLHIGKTGHFRKSGIPVPQHVFKEDLQRLFTQILFYKAEKLIIAGDLSHSRSNKEMDLFKKWRHDLEALEVILVNGNHDILDDKWYDELKITRTDTLDIDDFSFCHDPEEAFSKIRDQKHYTFCGHLHPGVSIRGRGRQFLQFPCFYFGNNIGILPAFSRFTGSVNVNAQTGENVFAIVENGIMQVQ